MDTILFSIKRVFHLSHALGRWFLKSVGLTPSRFDMLHVIHAQRQWRPIRQSDLRRILGVSAPTVSRMLRSLEKLDLVMRGAVRSGDRRTRLVWLTLRGRSLFRRAARAVLRKRGAYLLVATLLTTRWWDDDDEMDARLALEKTLFALRRRLFDGATLEYAWLLDH